MTRLTRAPLRRSRPATSDPWYCLVRSLRVYMLLPLTTGEGRTHVELGWPRSHLMLFHEDETRGRWDCLLVYYGEGTKLGHACAHVRKQTKNHGSPRTKAVAATNSGIGREQGISRPLVSRRRYLRRSSARISDLAAGTFRRNSRVVERAMAARRVLILGVGARSGSRKPTPPAWRLERATHSVTVESR